MSGFDAEFFFGRGVGYSQEWAEVFFGPVIDVDTDADAADLDADDLLERFGAVCAQLGLSPSQAALAFDSLPAGAQRAAWDDLARRIASSRERAPR